MGRQEGVSRAGDTTLAHCCLDRMFKCHEIAAWSHGHNCGIGLRQVHGTATPLGDPIEVQSLCRSYAMRNDPEKYCALGSVKSNIGHVIHAAGVASLIKASLAVKHNAIPPTLFLSLPL